jgi:ABC-2 type transport system permease protein
VGKFKLDKRSLKYGSNSIILIAVVIAIAVIINLLVGMGDIKWDLTKDKLYSLSDESKTIIKDIKKDVTIYGLFDDGEIGSGDAYKDLINLLGQYEKLGIKVSYIDPDKDPGTIASFDKDKTKDIAKGDFIVKSGNKVKKLSAQDLYGQSSEYGRMFSAEPLITGAIKFVTSDVTPIAYFVQGHDENSVDSDLTQVRTALENNNMEVKQLSLVTEENIPEDCKLLVFASPKKDLTDAEMIKVNAYLKKNGRVVFLFDPVESGNKFPNFEEVLQAYNVGINYDKVKELDQNMHLPGDEYSLVAKLESNDINSSYSSKDQYLFLPDSRSLSILKNDKEWLKTYSLAKTTDKAQAASILNQGETQSGPFDLAIASEIQGGSKVLVFGNGVFLTDRALSSQYSTYFATGANYFVYTIVNWMQDKADQTTISSKLVSTKTLTTNESQVKVISVVLMGVLPVLIMGCGFVVWSRRRHL